MGRWATPNMYKIQDSQRYSPTAPFSYGAGYVVPNNVMDPGLVYDTTMIDFFNFLYVGPVY